MAEQLLTEVVRLVQEAGRATLPFRNAELEVQEKLDESPVTAADLTANRILTESLQRLAPSIPVLSEEACGIPLEERRQWKRWWLVDPLDGTREFIGGSGEFTVNVALVEHGRVLWGVVGIPVTEQVYYGGEGLGAWRRDASGPPSAIRVRRQLNNRLVAISGRRNDNAQQRQWLAELEAFVSLPLEFTNQSSSLKFCRVAEGQADCYPRFGLTSQWDTAAAQGVLNGAGGEVVGPDGAPLSYSPREGFHNPFFLALPRSTSWEAQAIALFRHFSSQQESTLA